MKLEDIVEKMSLQDKIALCSGSGFWKTKEYASYGIPSLFMCDGPHGLRRQDRESGTDMLGINESRPATCFPAEVSVAGSWDPELAEEIGRAIGEEALEQEVGLVLGPGANIKRNPLCGRNFEYFSEDPYLSGKLAAGFIRGIESRGIGSSLKHFAANSQEKSRFNSDSIIDERTLRELYLSAFEIAVREGRPSSVMCAYPKLNGIHCSDHKKLLTDILRREWGFDGMVVTDWGAMNDRIRSFEAGCDLNMPGGSAYMEKEALRAVQEGKLPEAAVDASVKRILKLALEADRHRGMKTSCDHAAHHALSVRAAQEGAVLLKNQDNILPLKEGSSVAVIGELAQNMRFQGAGSSHINPQKLIQPLACLQPTGYARGCDDRGETDEGLLAEAASVAAKAEIALVFAGLPDYYESEGFDRENMKMSEGHIRMIETVARANPNTVVVLLCGGVVECPWAEQVKAVLYMGLPGQGGGEAIANLLYGRANPGGKLAESWPYTYEEVPSSHIYGETKDALYQEGIYVGYRYYDKAQVRVRWPFGYGLSYTSFAFLELQVKGEQAVVTIQNTGKYPGSEVVQLYIAPPEGGLHRPVRELKGFQKVYLQPGESKRLVFSLEERAFALWQDGWKVPAGTYQIQVGELSASIEKTGVEIAVPSWQDASFYADCKGKPAREDWEAMLGRTYTPPVLVKGQFTMDNTVEEMKDFSWIMKVMYWSVEKTVAGGFGGKADYHDPEFRMLMASSAGSPLRSMQISGGIKGGIMPGLLEMANGHLLRGIGKMLSKKY